MVWERTKQATLRREVYRRLNPDDDAAFIDLAEFENIGRVDGISDTAMNCLYEILGMHSSRGDYFASIRDIEMPLVHLDPADWNRFYPTICRSNALTSARNLLPGAIYPKKYTTSIGSKSTQSTVDDDLIPVDIFGKANPNPPQNGTATKGMDKVHLLPKEKDAALTWNYPAAAVLGLDISGFGSESMNEAILGIRNSLCNIVRMTDPQGLFDQDCRVFIFPVLNLEGMRSWQGTGYDAIVLCENGSAASQIGMGTVALNEAKKATRQNVDDAMSTASLICKFLAHIVLQKSEAEVNQYQNDPAEERAHATFRTQKWVPELRGLLDDTKPICKVSFGAHGSDNPHFHPAPDPMLLAFKSGNNILRKILGFRAVAGAEPLEVDDLSEEGQQNLQAYLQWQAMEEEACRHEEIMNLELSF